MDKRNKRILVETKKVTTNPPHGITVQVKESNMNYFDVFIEGPPETPFEGGKFHLEMFLPEKYPHEPPKVHMLTRIYHPNIDKIGRICLDILKKEWTPVMTIESTVLSIQALIAQPCFTDPLDTQICEHYLKDRAGAEQKAREWTKEFAV